MRQSLSEAQIGLKLLFSFQSARVTSASWDAKDYSSKPAQAIEQDSV